MGAATGAAGLAEALTLAVLVHLRASALGAADDGPAATLLMCNHDSAVGNNSTTDSLWWKPLERALSVRCTSPASSMVCQSEAQAFEQCVEPSNFNLPTTSEAGCPHVRYILLTREFAHSETSAESSNDKVPPPQVALNRKGTSAYAWIGAVSTVAFISFAGFGILGIIPALSKVVYKNALQFLIALAVGTLVGDAMLHLLPHAMVLPEKNSGNLSHGHQIGDHESHGDSKAEQGIVWHGCMALVGVAVFYNAERLLGVLTRKKADSQKLKRQTKQQVDACEREIDLQSSSSAECGSCANLSVIVGHSSREMKEMVKGAHQNYHVLNSIPCSINEGEGNGNNVTVFASTITKSSQAHKPLLTSVALRDYAAVSPVQSDDGCTADQPVSGMDAASQQQELPMLPAPPKHHKRIMPVSKKHELASKNTFYPANDYDLDGHGHSHHGGVPSSLSSVAYMVIAGDGMHNFTDGLAIGVAFAGSMAGGVSTGIAVLCHELPHELGDFAMLLKAGMTIKQAFFCNIISAGLCMAGSLIGVAIGNSNPEAEQWLFGLCGGIFLYIALVDMIPEISKVDKHKPLLQLLIQNLGLMTGFGIMLIIASFEGSMESAIIDTLFSG